MRIQNNFLATILAYTTLIGAPLTAPAEELFSPPAPGSSMGSVHITPEPIEGTSEQSSGVIVTDKITVKVRRPISAAPASSAPSKPKQVEPKENANSVCSSGIEIEGRCLDFGDEYLPSPTDTTQRPTEPVGC